MKEDCRGCDWLSFVRVSKNHNNRGDVEIYYCVEPERLENIGYHEIDGKYLFRCKEYTNIKKLREMKLKQLDEIKSR